MRPPIVSKKHIVQHTEFNVASASVTNLAEIQAVAVQDVNTATEVIEGSVIKAIYIEMWLLSDTSDVTSFVLTVEKGPINTIGPNFSQMTTLDAYPNKKNILYTTQGLLGGGTGSSTTNPVPVLRQWLKIPKGKQRFGLLDKLIISIACLGSNQLTGCGMTIYKSYQ